MFLYLVFGKNAFLLITNITYIVIQQGLLTFVNDDSAAELLYNKLLKVHNYLCKIIHNIVNYISNKIKIKQNQINIPDM